jgi:hypothetical protein
MQQEHMNQGPGLGIRRLCVSSRSPTRGRVGPAEGAGPNPGSCRTPSLFPFSAHLRVSAMLSVTWHAVSSHLACLVQSPSRCCKLAGNSLAGVGLAWGRCCDRVLLLRGVLASGRTGGRRSVSPEKGHPFSRTKAECQAELEVWRW